MRGLSETPSTSESDLCIGIALGLQRPLPMLPFGRSMLRADGCHLLGDWRTSSFRVDRPDVPATLTGRFRQPPSFGRSNPDVSSQSQAVAQAALAKDSYWPQAANRFISSLAGRAARRGN